MTADENTDLLLPEGTRLLHIGPQKTGTTAIQYALNRSRDQLREHGVVVPGKGPRPLNAVWSLLGTPDGRPQPPIKHWEGLVRQAEEAGDLRVCISTEDWARTDLDGAKKTVAGLGGDRAHVVATARRLDKLLPSQWQQRVKMRRITYTYEQWLEVVLGDDHDHPAWQNMWIPHDIESLVDRWSEAAGGRDRFSLIVADESDRGFLPRTFEQMLGVPAGMLGVAETEVLNPSRSFGRIEVIRMVTEACERNDDWPEDVTLATGPIRVRLTDELKSAAPWPNEQSVPPLPAWAAERVAELSAARADLVKSLDVRVIGNPDNLRTPPTLPTVLDDAPIMVSSALAARAIEVTIDASLERERRLLAEKDQEIEKLRRRLHRAKGKCDRSRGAEQLSGRQLLSELRGRARRRLPF